jgi:membrane-associated PAP2 superfamily phosphatase
MSRRGLIVALFIAAAVGVVFGFFPELDLKISRLFFDPAAGAFPLQKERMLAYGRDAATWLLVLLIAPAVLVPIIRLITPQAKPLLSIRAAIFLLATLLLGPGLLVNVLLKNHWDRPRPVAVAEFGGHERFVPWWDPRGQCRKNCSFVSGETSSAFWTLAPAVLAPPPWRLAVSGTALAFGVGMGIVRMAMGAHFFTDVVFAGVFTFLVIYLLHGLIFRTRTDEPGLRPEPPPTPA